MSTPASPPAVAVGAPGSAAVATGNQATTAAAVAALRAGGNAVDAAVAAGFAAAVAEPGLTSIAGGGFLVLRLPDGTSTMVDFFTTVPGIGATGTPQEPTTITVVYPGSSQTFRVGPAAAAVPGILTGLLDVHRRYGRRPLAELVRPAAELAENGVPIDSSQAYILQLIEPIVRHSPSAQAVYAPEGELLVESSILRDSDLAKFLHGVADGQITGLTSPTYADALLSMAADGCQITPADLQAYQPIWREPYRSERNGWEFLTNPRPAFGGEIIARATANLSEYSYVALIQAIDQATQVVKTGPAATTGTTQTSIVDRDGMVVSMTTTNGAGGGVMIPGTGIMLNNMLGEDDLLPDGLAGVRPGERLCSMSAPSILLAPDSTVTALGTGGSARIRSAISTVVARIREGGESLPAAIAGPRAHLEDSGVVQAELGLTVEALAQMRERYEVNVWDRTDFYFGGVNAVQRRSDGAVTAVADARRNGAVAIVSADEHS